MTDIVARTETTPRRAYAMGLMIFGSVGISFSGLLLRSVEEADAWQINFYRSLAFIATIAVVMLVRYRGGAVRQVSKVGMPGVFAGAMLAGAGMAFLQAITNTTVANTLFTVSVIPFVTAALAWVFLREHPSRATLITMATAALGVGVMMAEGLGGGGSLYGNGMALLTAICFATYAVVVRRYRSIDMLPTLIISGLIIILVSVPVRWGDLAISAHDIVLCILLGSALSGVTNVLFIMASRHLAAAELTLFMLLEFALGPVWVWLFINEVPTGWTIAGGGIVILSVAIRAMRELEGAPRRLRRGRPNPM